MKEGKTVWVLRHGLREDSDPVRWCESLKHMVDPDLQPLGVEMVERAAGRLAGEKMDHVLSSPFLRTIHSAVLVARPHRLPIKLDHGFHEMLDPKWFPDGMPVLPSAAERAKRFPEIDPTYESRFLPSAAEFAATDNLFGKRVGGAFEAAVANLDGNILVMTHYAVCNCLKNHITGSYMDGYIELTAIFKYVWRQGAWRVEMLSDASHVVPLYPKT